MSYLLVLQRILENQNVHPMLLKNYVGPASQHWVEVSFCNIKLNVGLQITVSMSFLT